MSTFVKTEPSACERAVIALLQRRGVNVPIVAVEASEAFAHPPTSQQVRVSQVGESYVTPSTGGAKVRTGGLLAAEVRVVGYGVQQPDLDGILLNRSHARVDPRHRHLTEQIDLLELEAGRGPGGVVGNLRAWSLSLKPCILPAAPPVPRGMHSEWELRGFGLSVAGEIQQRVSGRLPYAGELAIDSKVRAERVDPGTPDADGIVVRKLALHVEAWPIRNRGMELSDATRRAVYVLDTLKGRAWPNVGRVQSVSFGEPTIPEEGLREVHIRAEVDVIGWVQ